jgi:ketosteroid isomerase-like protein
MSRYLDAYHRNDAEALASLYASTGILLPPGRPLIRGREAIRRFWEQGMEADFQMENLEIGVSAGTGYAVGRYFIPPDDENDAESGKYVIMVRRQPGGAWAVAADIWNEDGDGSDDQTPPDSAARTVAAALRAASP